MAGTLGTIAGQIIVSGKQAIAEYAAVRAANATTVEALTGSSAAFATVGKAALVGGGAIAAVFGLAVDEAAKFEKKIDYFGAVTGASQADMQAVADKALAMSKTTVFSADQMADAFIEFGKAGVATKDILGGVADATAALAQAADINIADAATTIVSTMSTFGISAQDSIHIANELAGAANASIVDISDLATSMKYAGGVAAAAGVPFDSVVTALSLLGKAGLKGSTAGTTLRQVMTSLTAPTNAATKELQSLGIITKENGNLFIDQSGKLKPLDEIFQILKDHTNGLTQAQTLAATKIIFNSRALAGANILLQDGAAGFAEMNKEIEGVSAADVASKRLDNLAGDVTKLKNAIQTALIQAGTPFQEVLRTIVQHVTDLIRAFGDLSPSTQKLIFEIIAGIGAFLLIAGTISLFISVILRVILVAKQIRAAFILVRGAILAIRDGFILLGLVMEANPFILLITAIVALVAALVFCYFHFSAFRNIVNEVFNWLKNAGLDVWHALQTAFYAIIGAAMDVWHALETAFNAVKGALADVWNGIQTYFVGPIVDAWNAIYGAFNAAYKFVSRIVQDILDWFTPNHWRIIALVLGPIGLVIDAITNHLSELRDFFTRVWNDLVVIFTTVWNTIVSVYHSIVDPMISAMTTSWNLVWGVIQDIWNLIVGFFTTQWNIITAIFTTALNAIETAVNTVWTAIQTITTTVWNFIVGFLTPPINFIRNTMAEAFNTLNNVVHTVWNAIQSIISSVWNATINPIISAWKLAVQGVEDEINTLGQIWADVWNWIKSAIETVWGYIKPIIDKILDAVHSVSDAISAVGGFFSDVGGAIGGFFGFDEGGPVPGPKGAPVPAVVHGGEYVLSTDMIEGKSKIDPRILAAVSANQLAKMATNNSLRLLAAGSSSLLGSDLNRPPVSSLRQNTISPSGVTNDKSVTVENLNNYYPAPEPASDSLPRSIRKLAYLQGGPR